MKFFDHQTPAQRAVSLAALGLFAAWLALNLHSLTADQNGFLRFFLTLILGGAILMRSRPEKPPAAARAPGSVFRSRLPWIAIPGTLATVTGAALGIHQLQWLGMLAVLLAALSWSLPRTPTRDILPALLLIYWAHPLPAQVFGPVQLTMQRASVHTTEWLLHVFNVRVWAEDLALHTGLATFEIPAWCSGMRTATTVFLLSLGLGILKRMRWWELALLVIAALVQALFLNVFRIAIMVAYSAQRSAGSNFTYLHNTAGIVVFAGIILVYAELALWQRARERRAIRRQELNPQLKRVLTEYPPFWRVLLEYRVHIAGAIALLALAAILIYRSRPYHRAEMIKDVVVGLRDSGRLADAERAAAKVGAMRPDDTEWALLIARLMLIRHKYNEVLASIDTIPDASDTTVVEKDVLRSYSLMALDRMSEAAGIIRRLPETTLENDPRVAMILAEMGVAAGKPDEVARQVERAVRWGPNLRRIRGLYPYLRRFRKWQAIADTDSGIPYTNPVEALAAAEAFMNLNIAPAAGRLALQAMDAWPTDPRVLEPLFFMSLKRGNTRWEPLFAQHLNRCVHAMNDPEALHALFEKCFQLVRPDLAWGVYDRLAELDREHPALNMVVARFGNRWFTFRKQHIGIAAPRAGDTIDLAPFFAAGSMQPYWQTVCARVPRGMELLDPDRTAVRKQALRSAIAEFRRRAESDALSKDMHYEYVDALDMDGRRDEAIAELDKIAAQYPEDARSVRTVLSGLYERHGEWQQVYETLRDYMDVNLPQLRPCLRLCQAQLNLRLTLAALYTARRTYAMFPSSTLAASLLATALIRHGAAEEACGILSQPRTRHERQLDMLEIEALYRTQRYVEALEQSRAALLPRAPLPADAHQAMYLPPAELSVLWHRVAIPSEKAFAENARVLERNLQEATSPFLKSLLALWLDAYAAPENDTALFSSERWLACGRDRIEQATALNQLTLLLCRREQFTDARNAAGHAVKLFPEAPALWIALISLSGADPQVIDMARRRCPDDDDIWLAELVTRTRRNPPDENPAWTRQFVADAIAGQTLTPRTMTRAAEYLFRGKLYESASLAADHATAEAHGLLPAYVIGIKCALANRDWARALKCTQDAIRASLNPPAVLYEKLVGLKSQPGKIPTDREMVEALRSLREDEPDDQLWPQLLGYVRFQRGGWEIIDALYNMTVAIEGGATNRTPYLIAAESARQLGDNSRSADLLRRGLRLHPDDLPMLNNLVYSLAHTEEGRQEAVSLVPRLLERGTNAPAYLDTAAVAYLAVNRLDKAADYISRLLAACDENSREDFRGHMLLADIALRKGRAETAAEILRDIIPKATELPDEDILMANRLLRKAEAALSDDQRARLTPPDDTPEPVFVPAERLGD